ncbi:MAG: type II secretion system F family protein [Planctomycetes bacterium]|nr:type II secretion system F family protein [Planctomycetota bacterium]
MSVGLLYVMITLPLGVAIVSSALAWRHRSARRCMFFHHVGGLLRLGTPLPEALSTLGQEGGERLYPFIPLLSEHVLRGRRFGDALRETEWFTEQQIAIARLGEETGTLARCCASLAGLGRTRAGASQLLLVTLGYTVFLSLFAGLFAAGTDQGLREILDEAAVSASRWSWMSYEKGWPFPVAFSSSVIVAALVLSVALLYVFFGRVAGGAPGCFGGRLVAWIPGLRGHLWDAGCADAARAMAVLAGSNLSVRFCTRHLPDVSSSGFVRLRLREVASRLSTGRSLSASFREAGFPPTFVWLLQTAEATGRWTEALGIAQRHYEDRIARRLLVLRHLLFPLLLGALGLAIAIPELEVFDTVGRVIVHVARSWGCPLPP